MKPENRRFIGARLREAREARGLTAIALSELLGVTRSAVSLYETGGGFPRPEIEEKVSQILSLPAEFFRRSVHERPTLTVFYRSMGTATKTARTRAECRFNWLHDDIVRYLRGYVGFPEVDFPMVDFPSDPCEISDVVVEGAASLIRQVWKLGNGPIANVVWMLENHGVVVTRGDLGADSLDSFSAWVDGVPYVIIGTDKGTAVRWRFDAAHELGHLLLHKNVPRERANRTVEHSLMEKQAHRFAGALLLPESAMLDEVYAPTLKAFRSLKPKWKVSIAMMISRAQNLDLLSPEEARRLWIALSRQGWRNWEPLDDDLKPEEPQLLKGAFELILNDGIVSRDQVLSSLPYAPHDIEDLACLPRGFLTGPPQVSRLVTFHRREGESRAEQPGDGGTLVQMPGLGRRTTR